jgi:hypothetical protein
VFTDDPSDRKSKHPVHASLRVRGAYRPKKSYGRPVG